MDDYGACDLPYYICLCATAMDISLRGSKFIALARLNNSSSVIGQCVLYVRHRFSASIRFSALAKSVMNTWKFVFGIP